MTMVARGVRELRPDSFAVVMATGIVAIAASRAGMTSVSRTLAQIAGAAYAVLWLATLARAIFYGRRVLEDLANPARSAGFLTVVAATCVLGSQPALLSRDLHTAYALWVAGTALWVILMYAFFASAIVRDPKPSLEHGLDGIWLMPVVATQSVSLLGTLLAPAWPARQPLALFLALILYLLGSVLYGPLIVMIGYRLLFRRITPAALTPSYWINMGALAISTLAGALLIDAAPRDAMLHAMLPVLVAMTLTLWTAGTGWIPLLVILGVWKHVGRRLPLAYGPEYWAMVFPLGMYSACTFELAQVTGVHVLTGVAHVFVFVTLAAWVWAFGGLLRGLAASVPVFARGRSRVRLHADRHAPR